MPKIAHQPPGSSRIGPVNPLPGIAAGGRDRAVDVLRGLCIISMTTAHLAAGSWPWRIFHIGTFVDGAVGFVFLSGLVVGMTQRRAIDRAGPLTGQRKLLRRTAVIYGGMVFLCVVGFAIAAVDASRAVTYPAVDALGGPLPAALATLTLRYSPHYTSILSLYVVLLLLSVAAVGALALRQPKIVAACSVLLYAAGYCWPKTLSFPVRPGVPGPVNWATWQLLFVTALLVGWYWRSPPVRRIVTSRQLLYTAAFLVLVLAVLGWRVTHGASPAWWPSVYFAFTEGTLGPATIVMAFATVLVGYRSCQVLVGYGAVRHPAGAAGFGVARVAGARVAGAVVSILGRIGRRSLDCYLILSVVVIVLPSVFVFPEDGIVAVFVAFDVLALMFLWCLLRDRLGRARTVVAAGRSGRSR